MPTDVISPDRAKDPILIVVVALFFNGLAYFVYGQWQKGLAFLLLFFAGATFAVLTCGLGSFLALPFALAIVLDAYLQAKQLKDGHSIGQWTFFSSHL